MIILRKATKYYKLMKVFSKYGKIIENNFN